MSQELNALYVPRTDTQRAALQAYHENDILFLLGPAGSGKTHAAVAPALIDAIKHTRGIQRIILSRPQVTAGEEMGFLPGDTNEKMSPWMQPIHDVLRNITWKKPDEVFRDHIEIVPMAFMRGRTFSKCVAILDEAQNCKRAQLRMFLTRIGERGKLIICGDPEQSDINDGYDLEDVAEDLAQLKVEKDGVKYSVGVVYFNDEDIVRHPLIGAILDRLHRD